MNRREFNERVYNYTHGIKTVADDQSNSIMHYELGQEADPSKRKYIEKIPLGAGKFRYIYEDGTSSTGYNPVDAGNEGRVKQRQNMNSQAVSGYVEGKKREQAGSFNKVSTPALREATMVKTPAMEQAMNDTQQRKDFAANSNTEGQKRAQSGSYTKTSTPTMRAQEYDTALRKAQQEQENERVKASEHDAVSTPALREATMVKTPAMEQAISDTATRKEAQAVASSNGQVNTQSNDPSNVKTSNLGDGMYADSVASTKAPSYAEALRDTTRNYENTEDAITKGIAQNQETERSMQAHKVVDDYMLELDELATLSRMNDISEDYFWAVVNSTENMLGGNMLAYNIKDISDPDRIQFSGDALERLSKYKTDVLPAIQDTINKQIDINKKKAFFSSLTPEQRNLWAEANPNDVNMMNAAGPYTTVVLKK